VRVDLQPPAWATHLVHDLDDWLKHPVPVAEVRPFALPDDAYYEYAWLDRDGERRPDPANPNASRNPWWDFARWLAGPDYRPDPWAARAAAGGRLAGTVRRLRLDSQLLDQQRHVLVYSAPGQAGDALPHVWFQDGKAYHGWGRAPHVYELLRDAGHVAPAHLVFVPPVDRAGEYHFDDAYLRFLVEEALPAAEAVAPCDGRRTAWGASLGGLCSANLAWKHPLRFQSVVAQSGAFLFHPGQDLRRPHEGREFWRDRVRDEAWRPLRFHLQTGTLEWLHEPNRRLAAALTEADYPVEYVERHAGHNWVNWQDGIAAGLRFAVPAAAR